MSEGCVRWLFRGPQDYLNLSVEMRTETGRKKYLNIAGKQTITVQHTVAD